MENLHDDRVLFGLVKKLDLLSMAFDVIRIVDPIKKKVLHISQNRHIELETYCYDFWNRGAVCPNCISVRAYVENETFVKIEYVNNNIFMITAVPMEVGGIKIVVEMLKDITASMMVEYEHGKKDDSIHSLINSLNDVAVKDELTKIFNRRYIYEKLPVDMINQINENKKLAIIFTDIDIFKNLNDEHGHIAGDMALFNFVSCLESCIDKKNGDWIARYGGDEFLICLLNNNEKQVDQIAENMRRTVAESEIIFDDKIIKMTGSFGIFNIDSDYKFNIDDIIKKADEKLYKAKECGRNRVES